MFGDYDIKVEQVCLAVSLMSTGGCSNRMRTGEIPSRNLLLPNLQTGRIQRDQRHGAG